MESPAPIETDPAQPDAAQPDAAQPDAAEQIEVLQAATRVLTGVALRSLEALDRAVTLPQFRMLAVLADLGCARSARVARTLGLDASTVTRLADRLVAAGHVSRGADSGHRSVVTLELTPSGRQLVGDVRNWRQRELARMIGGLPAATRPVLATALRQLVAAAGEGYGLPASWPVPL